MNNRINRAPGVGGFLKRSSRFSYQGATVRPSERLVFSVWKGIRKGLFRPGESFPQADDMAQMTGESPATCVEAVNELLKSGVVRQTPVGSLFVTKVEPPQE